MKPHWQKGDWLIHEFRIAKVTEVKNGKVWEISDGYVRGGGQRMEEDCVELTLSHKVISEEYEALMQKLHKKGSAGLNYPTFKGWLVMSWKRCILASDLKEQDRVTEIYNEAVKFVDDVLKADTDRFVGGIPLTRPRIGGLD